MSGEVIINYETAAKSMIWPRCDGCPIMASFILRAKSLDNRVQNVDNENYFVVASHALKFVMEGSKPKGKPEEDFFRGLCENFGNLFGITPEEAIKLNAPVSDVDVIARDLLSGLEAQSAEEFEILASELEQKKGNCARAGDTCGVAKRS